MMRSRHTHRRSRRPRIPLAPQVNLLILSNREAHADLIARLRVDDVKRHKKCRHDWEARKAAWRQLRHDHALLTLKSYLHSPDVVSPKLQQDLLDELAASQSTFHERRLQIVGQLSSLAPPQLTEAEATKVPAAAAQAAAQAAQAAAQAAQAAAQTAAQAAAAQATSLPARRVCDT